MEVYHSDRFLYQLPSGHRFPIEKYGLVRDQLIHEGLLQNEAFIEPDLCPASIICRAHDPAYWARLERFQLQEKEERRIGIPIHQASLKRAISSAYGTLSAARTALEEGLAFNLGGGTHHAFRDHGEAFSMLNDLAITSYQLLGEGAVRKILIVDLDVHQGNGTASMMAKEERVFTFSMHGQQNYPFRKPHSDRDVGLPNNTGDETYLEKLEEELMALFSKHTPDLVLYQAGVDVLDTDRLGTLALSKEGCKERDRSLFRVCAERNIAVAVTMGGGYSQRVADVVDAHTATFREGFAAFGG